MVLVRVVCVGALVLKSYLASLFFFHLLKGFEEELLNVTSLIQNHLAECFQVLELACLQSNALSKTADVLTLFFDDLFTLET